MNAGHIFVLYNSRHLVEKRSIVKGLTSQQQTFKYPHTISVEKIPPYPGLGMGHLCPATEHHGVRVTHSRLGYEYPSSTYPSDCKLSRPLVIIAAIMNH